MTKYLLTIAVSTLCLATSQAAVTINLSGSPTAGPQFTIPTGALIPDGSVVRVGTFAVAPAPNATFASLRASFEEFGKITGGSGTDNVTGVNTGRIQRSSIAGSGDATSPQPDSFFATKQVYIWVYSGAASDNAPQGVFGSSTVYADQATAVSVSMGSFARAFGTFEDGGPPVSFTAGATAGTATAYRLAAPVPEPSASLLALLGVGLLSRRKR
jgi:PEP-CTERM motif